MHYTHYHCIADKPNHIYQVNSRVSFRKLYICVTHCHCIVEKPNRIY